MGRGKVRSREPGVSVRTRPPGRWALWVFVLCCLLGLGVAFELTRIHVWVHTEPSYRSFCAISETVNCDAVAESRFSVFAGVPVSVWGLLGYSLMAAVALLALFRGSVRWARGLLLALALCGLAASLVLGSISVLSIASVCVLCLGSYAINALLLFLSLWATRPRGVTGTLREAWLALASIWRRVALAALLGALAVGGLVALYPPYWKVRAQQDTGGLARGLSADGSPWIGARNPQVTIVEFSDYECPHCRRGQREIRTLVEKHPDRVRFVHRHFPLDEHCNRMVTRPFHPRACELARWVVCAARQNRGWEANDLLFSLEHGEEKTLDAQTLATRLGLDPAAFRVCLQDPSSLESLRRDIEAGLALGVRGTPSYQLGDELYPGHIPAERLRAVLGPDTPGH